MGEEIGSFNLLPRIPLTNSQHTDATNEYYSLYNHYHYSPPLPKKMINNESNNAH